MSESFWMTPPTHGALFSGVVRTSNIIDQSMIHATIVGTSRQCLIAAPLQADAVYTLYGYQLLDVDLQILGPVRASHAILAAPCDALSVMRVVEVCAGIGGIGVGADHANFETHGFLDKNSLAVHMLRLMGRRNVHQGDLTNDEHIRDLHLSLQDPVHVMTSGFNFRPSSYQGDQAGLADVQTSSFWGTLRAHYLLQTKILVLECTPGAGRDSGLQRALKDFADRLGFQMHQLFFNLANQWPAQRMRWWAILYPDSWPVMTLPDWVVPGDSMAICNVIPTWPQWSDVDLQQLYLTEHELQCYLRDFPDSQRFLNMSGLAPVFLHSYGNATGPCPCLCRVTGFSPERLQLLGLRGALLSTDAGFRFLHPQEVCLLMGWPADLALGTDLRAALCLLGNLASPLQSLWIFGHLRQILGQLWPQDVVAPIEALNQYKERLLFLRHHFWPSLSSRASLALRLHTSDGVDLLIQKDCYQRVKDLLSAERINLGRGQQVLLLDGGHLVPDEAFLHERGFHGICTLVRIAAASEFLPARGLIACVITHQGHEHLQFLPLGTLLCDALVGCDLPAQTPLGDAFGRIWPSDARLWHSVELFGFSSFGAGPSSDDGLTLDFITWVLGMAEDMHLRAVDMRIHLHVAQWQSDCLDFTYSSPGAGLLQHWKIGEPHFVCLLANHHWWLMACELSDGAFTIDFIDGFSRLGEPLVHQEIICWLQHQLRCTCSATRFYKGITQSLHGSCGTLMLLHLGMVLGLVAPQVDDDLEAYHVSLQQLARALGLHYGFPGFGFQPSEAQITLRLSQLLVEKGVPSARAEERAVMGMKKVGATEIQQALDSANPWMYLKAIGSRPHVSFQWLKADELQSKIRSKAASKFAIQPSEKRKKKIAKFGPEEPLFVDPAQLQLVPKTFFAKGLDMPQIAFADVCPQAHGLAFATVADLAPFLQAGVVISDGPLGILTTTPIALDQTGSLHVRALRFPALCKLTQEPVLVQGSLVTLGAVPIDRGDDSVQCALDTIPTQTLRLTVFKDQFGDEWSPFLEQPMRTLLHKVPMLSLCKQNACGVDCGRYHAVLDEPLDNLIMDLWGRSWHRADGKFTKPADAVMWSCLIRVPASSTRTLQALSGHSGLYVEPRSDSGKEVDPKYGIIWLGNVNVQDAHHKLKTTPNALALGRVQFKYGLRFQAMHMEAAHNLLKPDEQFTGTAVQEIYKLYPIPWGTQRAALQKCLTDWGWAAKVLQTAGGGVEGSYWEVGASKPPPSYVLQNPTGDIVVTHVRSAVKDPKPVNVVASAATKRHLAHGAAPMTVKGDPWHQGADPWLGPSSSVPAQDPAAASRIQQIEDRLQANLQDSIRKEIGQLPQQMDGQDDDFKEQTQARFTRLEAGLTELQAQHVKYEGWFAQMHQTDQFLSAQVEQTNQRLDQVNQNMNIQVASLHENVSQVRNEVNQGFANLEAMLNKRGKTS